MSKLRVHNLAISLDGYVAGPEQSLRNPIGENGSALHEWIFETRYGRRMVGRSGGSEGVDDRFLQRGDDGIGATVMGRNMFGPIRGPWTGVGGAGGRGGEPWTGWWGEEPPYHHPVFVLTHHARPPLPMKGGTTFHFVTDGIESALDQAREAADGADVRLGGGAEAVREYLTAGLVDLLHLAIVPVLLGRGERLFDHLDTFPEGFEKAELAASESVLHVVLEKKGDK
jgi:dihydrofolate reductase